MKKYIYGTFFILFGAIILQSFIPLKITRKEGAEPGHTGSPGDGLKNCTTCHGGSAVSVNGWITSDIPASGYVAGQTYNFTTTNTESEGTRFGFQISPQNTAGDLLGVLVLNDSVQTQLVGMNKYITYTEFGVDGIGSKKWSFKWIAPKVGTGNVTFYGAYNSNFNGHKDGDKTFLSTLMVKENTTNSASNLAKSVSNFSMYPNPSKDWISINFNLKSSSDLVLDIVDISGKQVAVLINERQSGSITKQFNTSGLAAGSYFVRIQVNGKAARYNLTVSH